MCPDDYLLFAHVPHSMIGTEYIGAVGGITGHEFAVKKAREIKCPSVYDEMDPPDGKKSTDKELIWMM
jgi:hypothetical protein